MTKAIRSQQASLQKNVVKGTCTKVHYLIADKVNIIAHFKAMCNDETSKEKDIFNMELIS